MEAEQDFRETEARVVDGDAEIAGQRHFEAAAEAIAVDHGDRRQRQPVEAVEHGMAARQRRLDRRGIGNAAELGDIGAGDEARALGRTDDQSARMIALDFFQYRVELGKHVFRQSVGAGIFLVEQQPGDAVLVGAQPPIDPGARLLRRFVDGERTDLDVALAENGQRRFWSG